MPGEMHNSEEANSKKDKVTKLELLSFNKESTKVIGESIGISTLHDDVCELLTSEIVFKLKLAIQDAIKFSRSAKRTKLLICDFSNALVVHGMDPIHGIVSDDVLPFKYASGGGREVYFHDERDLDLNDLVAAPMPKLPLDVSIKAHWLAVEGVQPSVAENPPPLSKDSQKESSLSLLKMNSNARQLPTIFKRGKLSVGQDPKHRGSHSDKVIIQNVVSHELSVEQHIYFKDLTEACVGSDEPRRGEALTSLSTDPGLFMLVPRFVAFIVEGVRINVVHHNLAVLIYLMRMVKSLLDNNNIYLEKYIHELLPTVMTCSCCWQLCANPDKDNHWALRDFAGKLVSHICKSFTSTTNNLQGRVTKLLGKTMATNETKLSTLYGTITCLGEMGIEVSRTFLVAHLRSIGERMQEIQELRISNTEMMEADKVKTNMAKYTCHAIKLARGSMPDEIGEYVKSYGYFGGVIIKFIKELRAKEAMHQRQQPVRAAVPGQRPRIQLMTPSQTPNSRYVLVSQSAPPMSPQQQTFVKVLPPPHTDTSKVYVLNSQKSVVDESGRR